MSINKPLRLTVTPAGAAMAIAAAALAVVLFFILRGFASEDATPEELGQISSSYMVIGTATNLDADTTSTFVILPPTGVPIEVFGDEQIAECVQGTEVVKGGGQFSFDIELQEFTEDAEIPELVIDCSDRPFVFSA